MSMAQSMPLHHHSTLTPSQKLASVNEESWLQVGKVAEMMNELDRAVIAYESALRHNPYSIPAMNQIAAILRVREQFPRAVEFYQSILNLDQNNGEVWGALGHCYLMMDDLQKAYSAYQQALYHLQNPKEPKLWYGIGILYDRYGSLEHAEEAFSQVMRMDPGFEKANEIYFRLGIIYKQQHKYAESLSCFRYIITSPPKPLTEVDVWFQIGHVYEQQKEYGKAKEAYERVLSESPDHAKVLQQLGWLYHQQSSTFANQDLAIQYLTKSLESDPGDAQSWYLLGRCYMAQQKYNKAYEAYQQAVYRDGRNPTFWCSIGVLYYQINQYRDALDAYSRAIRLNPYISEVWYDLGTLYESCNNQVSDALDAYSRAAELDPGNPHIKARLELLRSGQSGGARPGQAAGAAPLPQDVNPNAYQNTPQGPPTAWAGHPVAGAGPAPQGPPPPSQQHAGLQQAHQGPPQQQQAPPMPHPQQHPQQAMQMQQQQAPPMRMEALHQGYRDSPAKSPDRGKHVSPTNGHRSTPSTGKAGGAAASGSTYGQQATTSYSTGRSRNESAAAPQAVEAAVAPTTEGNLAPMLGRTSPVAAAKGIVAVGENTPRGEQASAPQQQQQVKTEQESATLKRPHAVMAETPTVDSDREAKKQAPEVATPTVSAEQNEGTQKAAESVAEAEVPKPVETKEAGATSKPASPEAVSNAKEDDSVKVPTPEDVGSPAAKPTAVSDAQPEKQSESVGNNKEAGVKSKDADTNADKAEQQTNGDGHATERKEKEASTEPAQRKIEVDEDYDD